MSCRRRDDLTVRDILWFEPIALSAFKEHPNRFVAAYGDTMIGVKYSQIIQRSSKVRLDVMGLVDRRFSVDNEVTSKERSTSGRNKLGKFRQVISSLNSVRPSSALRSHFWRIFKQDKL